MAILSTRNVDLTSIFIFLANKHNQLQICSSITWLSPLFSRTTSEYLYFFVQKSVFCLFKKFP